MFKNRMFENISKYFFKNPRSIFLLDAIGAVASAISLGVILVQYESVIGMPKETLHYLSLIACVFVVYSFSCFFLLKKNWAPFIRAIAYANLSYCFIQIACVIYHYQKLTGIGLTYFVLELIVVFAVVAFELKTANALDSTGGKD